MNTTIDQEIKKLNIDKSTWTQVRFGEIAIQQKENVDREHTSLTQYIKGEHMSSEDLHIRQWGELKDEYLGPAFIRKFNKGNILYGSRRTYLRKVAIAPFEGITSNTTFVIKANEDKIEQSLLPFIMLSEGFAEHSIRNSKGSVNPYVNWKDLANYEFLLPPKDQQAALAELLWAMDEVIEKELVVLERLEINLKTMSKYYLDYGYNSSDKNLPVGWRVKKIKEFAKVQAGSTPLRSKKEFFENGDIPWLKTLDLNNGEIYKTEECITKLAVQDTSCKIKPKNTVLVAMYGGFNQIGRTGILKIDATTNQAVSAIEVDPEVVRPNYLLQVLNTRIDYWKRVAVSSRKDPNITKKDVENFPVSFPNLDIQDIIVSKIEQILLSLKQTKSKIAASKALQKSLIHQLF